jgi:hypothetical protein
MREHSGVAEHDREVFQLAPQRLPPVHAPMAHIDFCCTMSPPETHRGKSAHNAHSSQPNQALFNRRDSQIRMIAPTIATRMLATMPPAG